MRHSESNASTDDEAETVHYYSSDWRASEPLTTRLTHALAGLEDVPPESLDTGIRSLVEPDALNTLFPRHSRPTGRVTLPLRGTEAHIFADGSFVFLEHS